MPFTIRRRRLKSCALIACAAVAAVAAPRNASAIIINGTPAQAETSAWDGVGTITQGFDPGTGTLLDATHVLTAAHLVSGFAASAVKFTVNGTQYNVAQISIAPGYVGGDASDIAVLRLSTPANGVATWSWNTGTLSELSKAVTIVGYGASGTGSGGADTTGFPSAQKKRAADNTIDTVTSGSSANLGNDGTPSHNAVVVPANMIAYDFDQTGSGNGVTGGASLGLTEGTIAVGDSGAPMFQFDSVLNRFVISGVAVDSSDFSDRFGEVGWGTRVSSYNAFIAAAVPEPTSLALLMLAALPLARRRK